MTWKFVMMTAFNYFKLEITIFMDNDKALDEQREND